jgi:hypothetical protein
MVRWGVSEMRNPIFRKKLLILSLVGIVVMVIAWFSWVSIVTAETTSIRNKVQGNLVTAIQIVERDAPRTKVNNANAEGYYEPNINMNTILPGNTAVWSKAYDILLENLNQDIDVPLCKVTNVTIDSNSTSITAHAIIRYEVFPAIIKTINVNQSMPIPHYKNSTGDGGSGR